MTYSGVESLNWSMSEQGIGIACACIMLLRRLIFSPCGGRAVRESQESIRTFGMDVSDSRMSSNTDLPNTDHESTVSSPVSEDMQKVRSVEDIQRPASAALIGVAVPLPKSESNTKTSLCALRSASPVDIEHCSDPRFSGLSRNAPSTPHLAAFKK